MTHRKKIVRGRGWTIIRNDSESVTILVDNLDCLTSRAYSSAVQAVANVKHVQIVLACIN